jgi:hypothetical protein
VLNRPQRAKTRRREPGQIVRIDLGDGTHSFAHVLAEPLIAFYDKAYQGEEPAPEVIAALPVAFTLMVMNHAITKCRWPVVGKVTPRSSINLTPPFCKQDVITGVFSIYQELPELAPFYERPAEIGECLGLETAAVWEPQHVEDRLRDHFAGRPNLWVESLKPKLN